MNPVNLFGGLAHSTQQPRCVVASTSSPLLIIHFLRPNSAFQNSIFSPYFFSAYARFCFWRLLCYFADCDCAPLMYGHGID